VAPCVLLQAATRGSLECINYLIHAGADVRIVDKKGRPAIVNAMLGGFME